MLHVSRLACGVGVPHWLGWAVVRFGFGVTLVRERSSYVEDASIPMCIGSIRSCVFCALGGAFGCACSELVYIVSSSDVCSADHYATCGETIDMLMKKIHINTI